VAWVVLGGRARCCGSKIPAWYTGLEVLCGIFAVGVMVLAPGPWPARLVLLVAGYAAGAALRIRNERQAR
jgi:prepilin signal peptidase PulO-like enzyme (type II secretory pathway)